MNDSKQPKPTQVAMPNLGWREFLLCALIVVLVAFITGFGVADPSQEGRITFSFLSAVVGGLIATVAVFAFIFFWQFFRQGHAFKTVIIPVGSVALISRHGRRIAVSSGLEIKINEALGEAYQLIDLRERQTDLEHTCKSADRKDVKLTGFIVWRIANVEAFFDRAQKPEEMMTRVMKAAMTGVVGRYEIKVLDSQSWLDALPYEIAPNVRSNLSVYGIDLVSVLFTAVELERPIKSQVEEETDRQFKIGQAPKEASENTIKQVEKVANVPLGFVAVKSLNNQPINVTHDPKVEFDEAAGETVALYSELERQIDVTQISSTLDSYTIRLRCSAFWRISSIKAFLDYSEDSRELIHSVLGVSMNSVVSQYEYEQLALQSERMLFETVFSAKSNLDLCGIDLVWMRLNEIRVLKGKGNESLSGHEISSLNRADKGDIQRKGSERFHRTEVSQSRRSALLLILKSNFSLEEIREICFILRIDFEDIEGETKSNKVVELIRYCERRDAVDELESALRRVRPQIDF